MIQSNFIADFESHSCIKDHCHFKDIHFKHRNVG